MAGRAGTLGAGPGRDLASGIQVLAEGSGAEEMWKRLADPARREPAVLVQGEEQDAAGAATTWQEILHQAHEGETRVRG